MKKLKIEKTIFTKHLDNYITWKDLKHLQFQDDDIINIEYIEPMCTTDYEHDGYFYLEVNRMIEETDEQYNKRMIETQKSKDLLKKNRYERFLELKNEFEPDNK